MDTVEFRALLEDLRERVNRDLRPFLGRLAAAGESYHPFVGEIYREVEAFVAVHEAQVSALALAASAGAGRALDDSAARLGSAIELYSHGILVHDDIFDRDDLRFGRPAFHRLFAGRLEELGGGRPECEAFGCSAAILAGSLMQSLALEALLELPIPPERSRWLGHRLASGYRLLSESQAVDLVFEHHLPTAAEWYRMAAQRASMHIRTTVELGGLLADWPESTSGPMIRAATELGFAYDIRDDLMDTFGEGGKVPSRVRRDLARAKKPLVLCLALERAPRPERERMLALLARVRSDSGSEPRDPEALAELLERIAAHGLSPAAESGRAHLARAAEAVTAAGLRPPFDRFFLTLIRFTGQHIESLAAAPAAAAS